MRGFVLFIIFILLIAGGFYLDYLAIEAIINAIPHTETMVEWLGLIKIGLWIFAVFLTGGIILVISTFITGLVNILISE